MSTIPEEVVRFELTDPFGSPDFKSGAIDLSATLPKIPYGNTLHPVKLAH